MSPERRVVQLMGMPISLAVRGVAAGAVDAAWAEAVATLRWVDLVFSTWRSDSQVSRLARGELALADCDPAVAEVLSLGGEAETVSGGAFSLTHSGRLDPTGVVKGWAVELAARHLTGLDFCLSAGGDLVCRSPSGRPWQIGIEDPHDASRLVARVPVVDGAVATSGTAHRGAHLVDGRTGRPPQGISSVTVVADSLTWADIDATAAYALGTEAASWLRSRGRTGLVVWADGRTAVLSGPSRTVESNLSHRSGGALARG